MGFKIVTWNINGLRSFGGAIGWKKIFSDFDADIICLQETKICRSLIEDWMAFVPDHTSYFSFPRGKLLNSGYSGVATFCRESTESRPLTIEVSLISDCDEIFPNSCKSFEFDQLDEEYLFSKRWPKVFASQSQIGLPVTSLGVQMWKLVDGEGRCLVSKHTFTIDESLDQVQNLFIFNVYCPRNDTTRPERLHFQLRFYHMLEKRALQLLSEDPNNHVMIVGDYNTTTSKIDVYDDEEWSYAGSYSRDWINELLSKKIDGSSNKYYFYDAFRYLHPNEQNSFTCWNVMLGCRATNFGSRLDYIVIDHKLLQYLCKCYPLTDYMGSDHCPVVAEFDHRVQFHRSSEKLSSYNKHCTKMWPEFGSGTSQTSIKNFFASSSREQILSQMNSQTQKSSLQSNLINKKKKKLKNSKQSKQPIGLVSVRNYFQSCNTKAIQDECDVEDKCVDDESKNELPSSPIDTEHEINDSEMQFEEQLKSSSEVTDEESQTNKWKLLFKQETPPKCHHGLRCVKRKSNKPGKNQGKMFFSCSKSSFGPADHPESRCNYFRWISTKKKNNNV